MEPAALARMRADLTASMQATVAGARVGYTELVDETVADNNHRQAGWSCWALGPHPRPCIGSERVAPVRAGCSWHG